MVSKWVVILITILSYSCEGILFDNSNQNNPLEVYDAFIFEIDQNYPYFEFLTFDFDSAEQVNRKLIEENLSGIQLAASIENMIHLLEDKRIKVTHERMNIRYRGNYYGSTINKLSNISSYFDSYVVHNSTFEYGELSGTEIGYIRVNNFSSEYNLTIESIDQILDKLQNKSGIIIDVRSTVEGDTQNSNIVLERFNDSSRVFIKWRVRQKDERLSFDEWSHWWYTSVSKEYKYSNDIVVLTNRRSNGAAEWFVAGMRSIPNVTVVGDSTRGKMGYSNFKKLPNGWGIYRSDIQPVLPDNQNKRYRGLFPDVPVWVSISDSLAGIDTILERAIEELNN